jgi:DNA-binding IclR family transcriptional regulator
VNTAVNVAAPRAKAEKSSVGINSIEIGVPLLRILAEAPTALPLTTLAAAAGMPPSKAHKYLASFIRCGFVIQHEVGGRYDLGPFALDLGLAAMRRIEIMDLAQPILDDLRDVLGTTVSMAVWANRGPTIVRIADTPDIMSLTIRIGTVMPLLTSSFGRCFAAFLPRQTTQEMMHAELAQPGAMLERAGLRTLADVESLLAQFRSRGLAVAENIVDPGRAAISAPVFDISNRMVAAVSAIGGIDRLDVSWEGMPARELLAASQKLSRRLGAREKI